MRTAEEKFYERAEELGIEEFATCKFGHYGVETPDGVVILVHEDEKDNFDEFRYPSMKELSKDKSQREAIFNEYDAIEEFDDETIGALYRWKLKGDKYDEAEYPCDAGYSGVYFACGFIKQIRFEDSQFEKEYDELYKKVKDAIIDEIQKKEQKSEGFWDVSFRGPYGYFKMLYNSSDDQDSYAELIVSVSYDKNTGVFMICNVDDESFHLYDDDFSLESLLHLLEAIKMS